MTTLIKKMWLGVALTAFAVGCVAENSTEEATAQREQEQRVWMGDNTDPDWCRSWLHQSFGGGTVVSTTWLQATGACFVQVEVSTTQGGSPAPSPSATVANTIIYPSGQVAGITQIDYLVNYKKAVRYNGAAYQLGDFAVLDTVTRMTSYKTGLIETKEVNGIYQSKLVYETSLIEPGSIVAGTPDIPGVLGVGTDEKIYRFYQDSAGVWKIQAAPWGAAKAGTLVSDGVGIAGVTPQKIMFSLYDRGMNFNFALHDGIACDFAKPALISEWTVNRGVYCVTPDRRVVRRYWADTGGWKTEYPRWGTALLGSLTVADGTVFGLENPTKVTQEQPYCESGRLFALWNNGGTLDYALIGNRKYILGTLVGIKPWASGVIGMDDTTAYLYRSYWTNSWKEEVIFGGQSFPDALSGEGNRIYGQAATGKYFLLEYDGGTYKYAFKYLQ